jgi:hypothetical protein
LYAFVQRKDPLACLAMTNDAVPSTPESSAEKYRAQAARLRQAAADSKEGQRYQLLEIAQQYDVLAASVERRPVGDSSKR